MPGDRSVRIAVVALVAIGPAAAGIVIAAVAALAIVVGLPPVGAGGPLAGLPAAEALGPDGPLARADPFELAPAVAGPDVLVIDVAGAVVAPGLHRLRAGDRVGDAIHAAGGFGPRADLDAAARTLNLAEPLIDGVKVLVPELGTGRPVAGARDGRIDLNGADRSALESLPGVGPVTAQRIIEAREDARFSAPDELRTRGLVGESVYERLRDLVRAGA